MAVERGEGGVDLVLQLVKPLQVAEQEPYGGRQWTIRPHYPIIVCFLPPLLASQGPPDGRRAL